MTNTFELMKYLLTGLKMTTKLTVHNELYFLQEDLEGQGSVVTIPAPTLFAPTVYMHIIGQAQSVGLSRAYSDPVKCKLWVM